MQLQSYNFLFQVKEIIAKVKQFLADKEIDPLLYILNAVLNSYTVEVQVETCLLRLIHIFWFLCTILFNL